MVEQRVAVPTWVKIVFVVLALLLAARFISMVGHTLLIFSFAAIVAFVLHPIVNFLTVRKVPRPLAVLIAYLLFLAFLVFIFLVILPTVSTQLQNFIDSFPQYARDARKVVVRFWATASRFSGTYGYRIRIEDVIDRLNSFAESAIKGAILFIPRVVGLVVDIILVIVISVYLLYFAPRIGASIREYIPSQHHELYDHLVEQLRTGMGKYIIGQVILSLIVGSLVALGSWILAIPFPGLLGLWAGITEVIPILGPVLGVTPMVVLALAISPIRALWALAVFLAIQNLENHLLSPTIMGNILKVNPLIIIFALIAGAEIRGLMGMLVAIPLVALGNVAFQFVTTYFRYRRMEEGDHVEIKKPK
jgi:predicted PurR-regulated permease PerM